MFAPPAHAVDAGPAPFAGVRAATLAISESYMALRGLDERRHPVDVPEALPTITLPFRSVITALLGHAGIKVQSESGAADLRVVVDCHGTTTGQLYDAAIQSQRVRGLRYTDAAIGGSLRLRVGNATLDRPFHGTVAPRSSIIGIVDGGDVRRDANYAPFREAFEASGGALDVLGGVIREVWGEAPLRAALKDRDPLVREAARRALDLAP